MNRIIVAGWCLLASAAALAQSSPDEQPTGNFAKSTGHADSFVMQESELALKQGDDDTAALASQLLNDNKRNAEQLKRLTGVDTDDPSVRQLDDAHQKMLDKLKTTSGYDFKAQFLKDAITEQRQEADQFQNYMQHGSDPQLRGWAAQNLPKLRYHLQELEALAAQN